MGSGDSHRLRWSDAPDGWIDRISHRPSPNFNDRPASVAIDTLIVHYISLPPGVFSGDAIERLFLNRITAADDPRIADLAQLRVSAHFVIRRRGQLLQFVGVDRRAWHAGPSQLLDRTACNDFSIGIELEGDGKHRFTEAQYRRLGNLVELLRTRHPLRLVAGHEDVAPGRKQDPGPLFDWERFLRMPAMQGISRPF